MEAKKLKIERGYNIRMDPAFSKRFWRVGCSLGGVGWGTPEHRKMGAYWKISRRRLSELPTAWFWEGWDLEYIRLARYKLDILKHVTPPPTGQADVTLILSWSLPSGISSLWSLPSLNYVAISHCQTSTWIIAKYIKKNISDDHFLRTGYSYPPTKLHLESKFVALVKAWRSGHNFWVQWRWLALRQSEIRQPTNEKDKILAFPHQLRLKHSAYLHCYTIESVANSQTEDLARQHGQQDSCKRNVRLVK